MLKGYVTSFAAVLLLWSCNDKFSGPKTPAGEAWLIKTRLHHKLEKKHDKCDNPAKCHTPDNFYLNDDQYNWIKTNYHSPDTTEELVTYRVWDQHRYAKLWRGDLAPGGSKTRNYVTKVIKFTFSISSANNLTGLKKGYYKIEKTAAETKVTMYSYSHKICPPPVPCTGLGVKN